MANRGQAIISGGACGTAGATHFTAFQGDQATTDVNSTELNNKQVISAPGTIDSLYVDLGTAPGRGETMSVTLRLNGADTALTVTISGTAKTGSDTSHSVAVVAGDVVGWKVVASNNGAYAAANARYSCRFIPTTADNFNVMFGIAGAGDQWDNTTTSQYTPAMTKRGKNATENLRSQVMPSAGSIKNLYVNINTAPGVGKTRTFTVFKNGVATTLLVVISGTNTSGNDTTHTVSYAAGDTISMECKADTSSASTKGGYGMTFVPTTAGEFPVMSCDANAQSTSVANYAFICEGGSTFSATETSRQQVVPMSIVFKAVYADLNTAPASGKSWAFALRKNAAATDLSASIANTSTAGNDTSDHQTAIAGDLLSTESTPSGTPTATGSNRISYCFAEALASTLTESITNTEVLTKLPGKTLLDTLTSTDTFASLKVQFKQLLESLTTTDTLIRSILKVCAESLTTTDTFIRSSVRTLTETITNTDTIKKLPGRILTETLTTLDSIIRTSSRTLTETITNTASFIRASFRSLSETITSSDSVLHTKVGVRVLSETFSIVEKRIIPLLNGILAWYTSKYTSRGTNHSSKYTSRGTTYTQKYE